jgi:DNA-binding winged helix-turn-helix (wHTH) protein
MRVAFGECVFDSERRLLSRGGSPVHLTPKAFQFLELLLAQRPRVLSREEISRELWPQTFVSAGSVATLAAEVRNAIADDARQPRYLRTVHRYGYAFCGETEDPPASIGPSSAYRLVAPHREFVLGPGEWKIGRAPDCPIRLDVETVSRHHAVLRASEDEASIEDLGSKNGSFLRNRRLTQPALLSDGDVIEIGSVRLVFRAFNRLTATDTYTPRNDS